MIRSKSLSAAAGALAATFFLAGGALAAGFGDTGGTPGTQASVIAMNQKPKSDSVSITYAFAPKEGTLAIYAKDPSRGAEAKPLGEAQLTPGDHRDIGVKLADVPKSGTRLWAVIEQGKNGKPFTNMDGPAEQSFKVM